MSTPLGVIAVNNTSTYIQAGLDTYITDNGDSKTVDCYLYFRRTNWYSGTTWSSSTDMSVTIDGSTAWNTCETSIPGYNNDWQGWYVHASKTFYGDARNIGISWSSSGVGGYFNGSGSATITVPASYTNPSTPSVSILSKTHNSATFGVSIGSYGNPAWAGGRYIEAAVLQQNSYDASASNARRWNVAYETTSANILVNNSGHGNGGPSGAGLTIVGNTRYYYGGYATNTQRAVSTVTGTFYTPCPPLVSIVDNLHIYKTATLDSVTFAYKRAEDGNAETRTGYYRYSTDNGATYSSWTSFGTINVSTSSTGFFTAAFPTNSTILLQVRIHTPNGGDSEVLSYTFNTISDHIPPNFSDFDYKDNNVATVALTGDDQTMIQGQSTPLVTVSVEDKATGNDDIDVSNYAITFIGQSKTIGYSSSSAVSATLDVPSDAGANNLVVSAVDNLSLSTAVSKSVITYPWYEPTISASIARENNFESESTLSISGTYAPIFIDNVAKNTISVAYRTKKASSSTWGEWMARPATVSDNEWETSDLVIYLDNAYQWDVQVRAVDKFSTVVSDLVLSVGIPNFFLGSDGRVSIGMKPEKYLGDYHGQLEVNGLIYSLGQPLMPSHIGQIIMTTTLDTSSKVSAIYGGYWEAWGEGRVPVCVDTSQAEFATSGKTGGEKAHTLTTNEIPAHTHALSYRIGGGGGSTWYTDPGTAEGWNTSASTAIGNTGGSQAHNNLQPYITCYMWKRVS